MSRYWNRCRRIESLVSSTNADDAYKISHAPHFSNAKQYVEAKLRILMDDKGFCINPTETEIEHLYDIARESEIKNWSDRKTEDTINRAVRQIIDNHWK